MGKSMKLQLAKMLSNNEKANKKAVNMKKSWDEVESLLKTTGKKKGK